MNKEQFIVLTLLVCAVSICFILETTDSMLRKNKNIQAQPQEYKRTTKKRFHQSSNEWKTIWVGDWGDWQQRVSWSKTDPLFYACGATIRVEPDQVRVIISQ